jgi:hypothetical protein
VSARQPVSALEINEDPRRERREWRVERLGWVAMAGLVTAALLGLLGGAGPLSHGGAADPRGDLRIEYRRFARHQAPSTLRVQLGPEVPRSGTVRLWLDRKYVDDAGIGEITPEPERIEATADRLTYTFAVPLTGRPTTLTYHLEPQRIGRLVTRFGLEGRGELGFRQLVLP